MAAGFAMMGCQNLATPAAVMQHIVNVESSTNPYAIGVVGAELAHQPTNLEEALATTQMLDANGYNFSLGLAQVNRNNLVKYGITSYEQAFQPCANLFAASQILAQCYATANGDWGKSLSCYYSGNFVTGYRDGYVQKIYDSIRLSMESNDAEPASVAAPIQLIKHVSPAPQPNSLATTLDSAAYRVAIRSSFAATLVNTAAATSTRSRLASASSTPSTSITTPTDNSAGSDVFVPQVSDSKKLSTTPAPASQPVIASASEADGADVGQAKADASFVF